MDGLRDNGTGIFIHGYQLNLRFADDIYLIKEQPDMLQANINTLNAAGEVTGPRTNINNTKTLVFGMTIEETIEEKMKVGDKELENVTEFEYLSVV